MIRALFSMGGRRSFASRVYIWQVSSRIREKTKQYQNSKMGIGSKPAIIDNMDLKGASRIFCGVTHSFCLSENGTLYAFGKEAYGSLGIGSKKAVPYTNPVEVTFFTKNKLKLKDVALGEAHSVFLTEEGEVYTCGYGGEPGLFKKFFGEAVGALGHGTNDHLYTPAKVQFFSKEKNNIKVKSIAAGRYHTVALTDSGDVYTWGRGQYGTLGTGKTRPSLTPVLVSDIQSFKKENPDNEIIKIDAAEFYTACVTKAGDVAVWGENDQGQLGIGSGTGLDLIESESSPTFMRFDQLEKDGKKIKITDLYCGESTVVLIDAEGVVYRTGAKLHYTPQRLIEHQGGLPKISKIRCGRANFSLVNEKNELILWGDSMSGANTDKITRLKTISGDEMFKGKIVDLSTKYSVHAAVIETK